MIDDNSIARDMRKFLNTWPDKPKNFTIEQLDTEPPAIMFQPLSGTRVVRTYVDGTMICAWPFSVCYRVNQTDTAVKLSAYDLLESLAVWITDGRLPDLQGSRSALKIEQASTPSQIAIYSDGTEDYQAMFTLEYKERKG